MIVLIKTNDNKVRKALVRNKIFTEVDENNRKGVKINTANISSVFWPNRDEMQEIEVSKWNQMAEDANFWGLT